MIRIILVTTFAVATLIASASGACDMTKDYFPVKYSSESAINWDVTYHMYYKEVTFYQQASAYIAAGIFKYVLVQNGCVRPSSYNYSNPQVPVVSVTVPVVSVVLSSTSELPYLEILGLRNNIVGMAGFYTTSPCANKRIVADQIISLDEYGTPAGSCAGISPNVSFGSTICTGPSTTTIQIGDVYETKLLQQLEWLNFFSLFFNKESAVGTYIVQTESAMSCIQSTVNAHVAVRLQTGLNPPRKRVLWGTPSYPDNENTWSQLGTCPNYYCDAVLMAGGVIINDLPEIIALSKSLLNVNGKQINAINNQTVTTIAAHNFKVNDKVMYYYNSYQSIIFYVKSVPTNFSVEFMSKTRGAVSVTCTSYGFCTEGPDYCDCKLNVPVTSDQILYAAASIDVVISEPMYDANTSATCLTFWNNLPATWNAMKTKSVYDVGKSVDPYGGFDWYSSRYALADVVLEDIASILYPELGLKGAKGRIWLQNVYTEGRCKGAQKRTATQQKALAAQCTNPAATFVSERNTYCQTPASSSQPPLQNYAIALIVVACFLGVAIITGAILSYRSHQTIKSLYSRLQTQDAKIDPDFSGLSAPLTSDP